jgi:methionyl-tRNA formyltransferase
VGVLNKMFEKPKIAYFGNQNIGYNCLKWLLECGENVSLVVGIPKDSTETDYYNSVTELARNYHVKTIQPNTMKSQESIDLLKEVNPDIIFTISYRFMLPQEVLDIPPLGGVNFHAAPLPKYRGCAPLNWAVINGEKETAITFHYLVKKADEGDIIAQEKMPILFEDTAFDLWNRATEKGFRLFKKTYPLIISGKAPRIKQIGESSYFGRRKPEDGEIKKEDWKNKDSMQIYNLIRALTKPFPGAFSYIDNDPLFIWKGYPLEHKLKDFPSGEIYSGERGVFINTKEGCIELEELSFKGKDISGLELIKQQNLEGKILGR